MKRRARNSDVDDDSGDEIELDAVSRLVNRSFVAFRCTPFWDFKVEHMSRYERQFKEFMMIDLERALKEARDNGDEEEETEDLLRGRVLQVELKGQTISPWRGGESNALTKSPSRNLLSAHALSETEDPSIRPFELTMLFQPRGKPVQKAYSAVFMSALSEGSMKLAPGFSHFPLALIKADAPIIPLITRWFESNFGGHISPMRIPPWILEDVTEEWALRFYDMQDTAVQDVVRVPRTRTLDLPLELRYDTGIDELKTVTVNIPVNDLLGLIERAFFQLFSLRVTNNHSRLMDIIQLHILETTSIDVTKLILSRAGNPASYISTDGKVKLMANQSKTLTLQVMRRLMAVACENVFGP
ncbi:hypothetical protein INT43_001179 [Umbelopsis isabellina]|uniref:Uncharacterized protein n=1 Tax=Mortierella isabellina TaxID=91625 RepID=A0A8H7PK63_MORIS|nr:hypothetical protein INT43_001179 [Umbelopsis isabellina]